MFTFNKLFSLTLFSSLLIVGACVSDDDVAFESDELLGPAGARAPMSRPVLGRPTYAPGAVVEEPTWEGFPSCNPFPTEIGHGHPVVDVAAAGTHVYAAELNADGTKGAIVRYPREGGAREQLVDARPLQLAATDDTVYWLQERTPEVRMLMAVGTDGGAPRLVAYTGGHSFVIDTRAAYLLGRDVLERVDLTTGEHTRQAIATTGAYASTLAQDDTHVWFMARYSDGIDAYHRVDKGTGVVEPVAKVDAHRAPAVALAVNPERVVAIYQVSREKALPVVLEKDVEKVWMMDAIAWHATDALFAHHELFVLDDLADADLWGVFPDDAATLEAKASLAGTAKGLTADGECAYFGLNEGMTGYILSIAL